MPTHSKEFHYASPHKFVELKPQKAVQTRTNKHCFSLNLYMASGSTMATPPLASNLFGDANKWITHRLNDAALLTQYGGGDNTNSPTNPRLWASA